MGPREIEATFPDADTGEPQGESPVPMLALVLLWSAAEPHRAGEVAFLFGSQSWYVGRGDDKPEEFLPFARQCPGETVDPTRRAPCLQGRTMSERQLQLRVDDGAVEMNQVGKCLTLVNGDELRTAQLVPGDVVLVRGVAAFLCVRRPRTLPVFAEPLQPLGEADVLKVVGESAAIWQLRHDLAAAAQTSFHVLIEGETGAGKEMASAAIHKLSARRGGPYLAASAAVRTETLLESKLFGNAQNFPNPGTPARKGLFAAAEGGTLFLDEIGDCPPDFQASLLRALSPGEITVLGESAARRVDTRVVGATNGNLQLLRPEIYFRLRRRVRVPALTERREDIPLLLRHLAIERAREEPELMKRFLYTGPSGRTELQMSGRVVDYLVRYPFTGNVRQLATMLDELIDGSRGNQVRLPSKANSEGVASRSAGPASVPPVSGGPASGASPSGKPSVERVRAELKRLGNVRKAAEVLGMTLPSFYRLLKQYGIAPGSVG
jgi:DNA-binding NtrC family response regulator